MSWCLDDPPLTKSRNNWNCDMHKNTLTPDNAAIVLIDHQVGTMSWTHSLDINIVRRNTIKLAQIANALKMPVVLTSSLEDQPDFTGPLSPELQQLLPEAYAGRNRRPDIVNAMHHEGLIKAVKAPGRKKLFVDGI